MNPKKIKAFNFSHRVMQHSPNFLQVQLLRPHPEEQFQHIDFNSSGGAGSRPIMVPLKQSLTMRSRKNTTQFEGGEKCYGL